MSIDQKIERGWQTIFPSIPAISHEDVEMHTQAFLNSGGQIQVLKTCLDTEDTTEFRKFTINHRKNAASGFVLGGSNGPS